MNAAKISHLVSERTIGQANKEEVELSLQKANGNHQTNDDNVDHNRTITIRPANKKSPKNKTPQSFRNDVWREVKADDDASEPIRPAFQLNDYKMVSFCIAMSSAEKQRKALVQSKVAVMQNDIHKQIEDRLRQIRIESAEEAQKRQQAKRQQYENVVLDAIKQYDESARESEAETQKEMIAMIEHNRKVIDRANKIKRDEELRSLYTTLNATKTLFISQFESFAKTVISTQAVLKQIGKLKHFNELQDSFLDRYEKIIQTINSKHVIVSADDVTAFEKLCEDVKIETSMVNTEIKIASSAAAEATARAAAAKAAEAQAEAEHRKEAEAAAASAQLAAVEAQKLDAVNANHAQPIATADINEFVNPRQLESYVELSSFLEEYITSIKPLQEDVAWKSFRFNCQKAVNIPVNAISNLSAAHLRVNCDYRNKPSFRTKI